MPSLDEIVTGLRSVLADLQGLDLWPPWDAAQTIVDLVARAVEIATEPPEPDPEHVDSAASEWRLMAGGASQAGADLESLRESVPTTVWDGVAGASFRVSVDRLGGRLDTVPTAARAVAGALTTLSGQMASARSRHARADDLLRNNLQLSWGDMWPWELVDWIKGVVEGVISAVEDAIGAYSDAAAAVALAKREIVSAMDEIELPTHLPSSPGVSAVDVVNAWQDHHGPLRGNVLERYDGAFDDLSPAEQQSVRDALAGAEDEGERGWIMSGVAAGLSGPALLNYLRRLHSMTPQEREQLDPTPRDPTRPDTPRLVQPDTTTCGSSALVMSRMLNDPAYAMWITTGYDPETGATDDRSMEKRFIDESHRMHLRTNLPADRDGDLQFPWPPQIGTQPWALANEMSADGGSGVPGTEYDVTMVDPDDRGAAYDAMVAANEDGHTVPLYVGDQTRPGHIVLVTGSDGDSVTIYDPASGDSETVSRDDFVNGTVDVAGWDEPWFAVTPR